MNTKSRYILRTESFEIGEPEVFVETISNDVQIRESLDGSCRVEISGKSEYATHLADAIDISASGKTLHIRAGRKFAVLRQLFEGRSQDLNIFVWLPKASTLKAKMVSGDIEVAQTLRSLEINSVSGDISVLQNPTLTCKLNSVSGDITTRTFSGCNYSLKSVSGDITVHVAPGLEIDVDGRSVSGKMASEISLDSMEGT